jgi:hypothetical protein
MSLEHLASMRCRACTAAARLRESRRAQAAGVYEQWGIPVIKPLLIANPSQAKSFASRVLGWDFCGLVPSHGAVQMPVVRSGWPVFLRGAGNEKLRAAASDALLGAGIRV